MEKCDQCLRVTLPFYVLVFALIPFLDSPTQMYRLLVPKMILTEPRYVHLT